jgi:hypothetical protein
MLVGSRGSRITLTVAGALDIDANIESFSGEFRRFDAR